MIGRILAAGPEEDKPIVEDHALLLIKRHDVVIGCTPGDAGVIGDAATDAVLADAGLQDASMPDGGSIDAGDAGVDDGGTDAGMGSECTMIPGDAITMILQPRVSATPGSRFAVLLVTPARPIVELQSNVFEPLVRLTAPIIKTETEYVENPELGTTCYSEEPVGCGGGCSGGYGDQSWTPPGIGDGGVGDGGLIEETLGPYQFIRAQPTSAMELAGWLTSLGYAYAQDDLDAVAPYIALGYHVVALRVVLKDSSDIELSPIALTWPGSELRVPAALGRAVDAVPGPLTVYVAADQKYVLPGAEVPFAKRTNLTNMGFLTRNELVLDQNQPPSNDPIALHSDNTEFHASETVTEYVDVPVHVDCYDHDTHEERGCCNDCNAKPRNRLDLLTIVLAVGFVLRRRRR